MAAGAWSAEVIIQMLGTAKQFITSKFYEASGLTYNAANGTESNAVALPLYFEGTAGNGTITQYDMRVMPR
jgi:hypothetical protein